MLNAKPKATLKAVLKVAAILVSLITSTSSQAAEFNARDLAAEEGKFAVNSVKNGMRAAFLEFFADTSWLLRPELVDAKSWLRGRPDPAIVLDWRSQRTILSVSGDLGFSTGPWLLRSKADPKSAASHGQFLSVWQKQSGGEWRVFIDHGISHEPTDTPDALSKIPLTALDLTAQGPEAEPSAHDAEQKFIAQSNRSGAIAAYRDVITHQSRLLREGMFPINGTAAINEYLKSQEGEWSWTTKLQGASRANDFAYAVGNFNLQPKQGAARKGQYVRVWIRDLASKDSPRWTLAAEVMTPEPLPKS